MLVWAAFLLLLNFPLFAGRRCAAFAYQVGAVAAGEWWRVFTHPFVHVSWYHFLLDGAAFLVLYHGLQTAQLWRRLAWVACTAAGSLAAALAFSPRIAEHGLCGLSGVGHGLMAISALEVLAWQEVDRRARTLAVSSLLGVTLKCACEAATGSPFFHVLHFGLLGVPIVECHAGGVLGGLAGAMLLRPPAPTSAGPAAACCPC